jgi:hypothetical protein
MTPMKAAVYYSLFHQKRETTAEVRQPERPPPSDGFPWGGLMIGFGLVLLMFGLIYLVTHYPRQKKEV